MHPENAENRQTEQKEIIPENNIHKVAASIHQQEADKSTTPFEKSGLRLVTDLQHCIKSQQSKAYAGKVKLTNLQTMAKTLSYIQEHGYDTMEDVENKLSVIKRLPPLPEKN